MLTEVCEYLRNWFITENKYGEYTVADGSISLDFVQSGQYFRIAGSVFNDGVWQSPVTGLTDETFTGLISAMSVPPSLLALVSEIQAYQATSKAKSSPYTSESFGGYSYSRATNAQGAPLSWQEVFGGKLRKWRKL